MTGDDGNDTPLGTKPPVTVPARSLLVILAVVAAGWLALDYADPCRGQITDLLGCAAAAWEHDQAEIADVWADWCAEVGARYVSPDGRYIHADYEADYERGCVPGTDMQTLDDVEGLP